MVTFNKRWGNLRITSFRCILVAFVILVVLDNDECGVVSLPVEVEGELSELANKKGMGVRLIEAEEEESPPEEKVLPMSRMEAVKLLLHKYKEMEEAAAEREEIEEDLERSASEPEAARVESARAIWTDDFQRKARESCGTKASLDCGKRILGLIEGEVNDLSVHMKCDLRDEFLKCIDTEKRGCLDLARSSILPDLPPKEEIKTEQSKLWKVLWTAGGCVLAN